MQLSQNVHEVRLNCMSDLRDKRRWIAQAKHGRSLGAGVRWCWRTRID